MDLGIKNKTAVVQASSKGLGLGVARALSVEGANVIICSRNLNEAEKAANDITSESGNPVIPVKCDVTIDIERENLFNVCRDNFGDPEILITNAGGPPPGKPQSFSLEDFSKAVENNFLSAVASVQSILPSMKNSGWGRIVFITSAAVKQPVQHLILSNTARSALNAYAKTLATDLASTGITVNTILPGMHKTARVRSLVESISKNEDRQIEEVWTEWQGKIPMGRLGTIEEFGSYVAFLCSKQAGFITGQALVHDGGATQGLL